MNGGASEWERGGGRSDPCRRGDGGCDWPEPQEWVQGFAPIGGGGWLDLDSGGRFLDHTSSEEATTCPAAAQPNASRIIPLTRGYPFCQGFLGERAMALRHHCGLESGHVFLASARHAVVRSM